MWTDRGTIGFESLQKCPNFFWPSVPPPVLFSLALLMVPRRATWWMNSQLRMVKSGSRTWGPMWENLEGKHHRTHCRICFNGDTGNPMSLIVKVRILENRCRFSQENHWTQEMKRKSPNARRQERVRKCARDSGYERSVFLMRLKDGFDWEVDCGVVSHF